MSFAENFEDLEIWKLSRIQVASIYQLTKGNSDIGFCSQIQRASVSVMNNIAEGFERRSSKDFSHFLNVAKASCGEVRSMLYIAEDLGYAEPGVASELRENSKILSRKIAAFSRSL